MSQLNFRYKVSLSAHRPVPKPRRICGHRTGDWSLLFSPFKPHDRAVSKSVEQKPEIITEQMLSGLQFNEPLALWTFAPKTLQPQDSRRTNEFGLCVNNKPPNDYFPFRRRGKKNARFSQKSDANRLIITAIFTISTYDEKRDLLLLLILQFAIPSRRRA
jgi:hypothetical protein